MHALLYKDFRVMWKQMKAFLLLIAIFCLIPNQALNLSAFFVVYAGLMLPMSLMSYDERAKWRGKGTTLHDDFLCGLAGPGGRLGRPGWGGAAPGQHPLPFGRTGSPGVGPAALPGLGASVRPAVCKTAGVTLPSPPMLVPAAPPISPSAAIHPMGPQPSNCGKISA